MSSTTPGARGERAHHVEQAPRGRERDRERAEELDRRGDAEAEQVHRLVEREVHDREHDAERERRPEAPPRELGALRPVEGQHGGDHHELAHGEDD